MFCFHAQYLSPKIKWCNYLCGLQSRVLAWSLFLFPTRGSAAPLYGFPHWVLCSTSPTTSQFLLPSELGERKVDINDAILSPPTPQITSLSFSKVLSLFQGESILLTYEPPQHYVPCHLKMHQSRATASIFGKGLC